MSFSADKVNILKGSFSQRRFSSSKDPSESGTYCDCFFGVLRHISTLHLGSLGDWRLAEHYETGLKIEQLGFCSSRISIRNSQPFAQPS
jgi:hypothetical protein